MRFVFVFVIACGGASQPVAHVEIAPPATTASSSSDVDARAPAVTHLPTPSNANSLIARTCGPTDGPATVLVVTDRIVTCDDWSRISGKYASIEVWGSLDIHEGAVIALPGSMGGQVTTCEGKDNCAPARASLQVDHVTADDFTGTLVVTPANVKGAMRRELPVRATRCNLHIMCG